MEYGKLFWITGLSGAGKTTLAKQFYAHLKPDNRQLILLDGDVLREIYDLPDHYCYLKRKAVAMRHAQLCRLLTSQNMDVICATISLFEDVRAWNREHIKNYYEIYLELSEKVLLERNHQRLINDDKSNKLSNVVGLDVKAEFPKNPDVLIFNDGSLDSETVFLQLLKALNL